MKIQHYDYFKKIKDWDEEFANAEIKVNSDLYLRRSGTHSKSFITDYEKESK